MSDRVSGVKLDQHHGPLSRDAAPAQDSRSFSFPGLWPTRDQMLVLRAALLDGEPAKQAFYSWVKTVNLDEHFDEAIFRLFPLLYSNLSRMRIEHPIMSTLKGVYRLSWYKNQKVLHTIGPVLGALRSAGIPILLLKGVPLVMEYYPSAALRPMADVDIMVPLAHVLAADSVFMGLRFNRHDGGRAITGHMRFSWELEYLRADDQCRIDLHWGTLPGQDDETDAAYWKTAHRVALGGADILVPDATRMLFHTIVHGVHWNPVPPVRWIADAIMIMRAPGKQFEWREIVDLAKEQQFAHRLHLGLLFLKQEFDAPVPMSVIEELQRSGVTWLETITNVCNVKNNRLDKPSGRLLAMFGKYCRIFRNKSPVAFVDGFLDALQFSRSLSSRWHLLLFIARRGPEKVVDKIADKIRSGVRVSSPSQPRGGDA